jgi:hypothetical protein
VRASGFVEARRASAAVRASEFVCRRQTHVVLLQQVVRGGRRWLGQARRDERFPVTLLAAVLAPSLDRLGAPAIGRRRSLTVVRAHKLQECLTRGLQKRGRRSEDLGVLIVARIAVLAPRVRLWLQ